MELASWIKNNKIPSLIIAVLAVGFILASKSSGPRMNLLNLSKSYDGGGYAPAVGAPMPLTFGSAGESATREMAAPVSDFAATPGRMVTSESYFSLQVDNVNVKMQAVKDKARELGGYMVSSYINRPTESPVGNLTVRVPVNQADGFVTYLRDSAVKVVSENLLGRDITQQYQDNEARLVTLQKTRTTFEAMMEKTENIDQLLRIQRELMNLQSQIDSVILSQKQLEESSGTVAITIYMSTDEFGLPYAPDTNWRPEVVFKLAVRSLVITLRGLADKVIWLAVYGVIWIPVLLLLVIGIKWMSKKSGPMPPI